MSNVTLRIGGRGFQVACAPGEEDHVQNLARIIDEKLSTLGAAANQSESRMLLFAALMLADELHERPPVAPTVPAPDKRGESWRLAEIADRLENLASELEAAAADD
jgi:cell division protein ZapA